VPFCWCCLRFDDIGNPRDSILPEVTFESMPYEWRERNPPYLKNLLFISKGGQSCCGLSQNPNTCLSHLEIGSHTSKTQITTLLI
jgi:hypothetical protein